jgi:hypothetical protein
MDVYLLRRLDRIKLRDDTLDFDDIPIEVIKVFQTKSELLQYCKEREIELDVGYEFDDSWQNYACDHWVAYGYDYIVMPLQKALKCLIGNKIEGESFVE